MTRSWAGADRAVTSAVRISGTPPATIAEVRARTQEAFKRSTGKRLITLCTLALGKRLQSLSFVDLFRFIRKQNGIAIESKPNNCIIRISYWL